ncbi:MAG: Gfo/Idh/MocA family oxidoreductase [Thermodesulfobacteriota bacterium]
MGQDKVGLAVIGTGAWSGVIGDAMVKSERVELVTCFDPVVSKREAFSKKFGCGQEKSLEDVLAREDVEGIHLTTPNAVHAEQAVLAARCGKHVFVDKPIANTVADAESMIAACNDAPVVLMVGHHLRRLTGFRKIKELIDGGAIGDFIQVDANFSQNLGFALTPDAFRWRGDDTGCPAGALMTLGIHHADLFHYLFGPITEVFSFFSKLYIPAPVEDVTTTIFRFGSGALGYLGSNYASPKALWMYIYGTEANILCTVTLQELPFEEYLLRWQMIDADTRLQIYKKGKTGAENIPLRQGNPILEEIDEFADCIRNGGRPETDGRGALVSLKLIRAAMESARTGEKAYVNRP